MKQPLTFQITVFKPKVDTLHDLKSHLASDYRTVHYAYNIFINNQIFYLKTS